MLPNVTWFFPPVIVKYQPFKTRAADNTHPPVIYRSFNPFNSFISNSCFRQPAPELRDDRVSLHFSRTLAEESAHGGLGIGRQGVEQLVGVEAGGLHELAGGGDDALRHVALQGFGFEGLGDVGEALRGLCVDGGVGSRW